MHTVKIICNIQFIARKIITTTMSLKRSLFVSSMPFSPVMDMPTVYSLHCLYLRVHPLMRYNVPLMNSPHSPDRRYKCTKLFSKCQSAQRRRCFLEVTMCNSFMQVVIIVETTLSKAVIITLTRIRRVMQRMIRRVKT